MTLPAGGQTFDVILDFVLKNEDVLARVQKETAGITDVQQQAAVSSKILAEEIEKVAPGFVAQAQAEQKAAEAAKAHSAEIRLQIRDIRARAREITVGNRIILQQAGDIDRIAKPVSYTHLTLPTNREV